MSNYTINTSLFMDDDLINDLQNFLNISHINCHSKILIFTTLGRFMCTFPPGGNFPPGEIGGWFGWWFWRRIFWGEIPGGNFEGKLWGEILRWNSERKFRVEILGGNSELKFWGGILSIRQESSVWKFNYCTFIIGSSCWRRLYYGLNMLCGVAAKVSVPQ